MRLVRLYSDQPDRFLPIEFNDGLSAILAEIRVRENRDLHTHNLGKTTIGSLIDFCLIKGKDAKFFLFKHEDIFKSFAFFLEIEIPDHSFLTIRRAVVPGSKIDFLRSDASIEDAAAVPDEDWDHRDVPFDRARNLLDGMLGIDALRPWGFRKLVGYLVRTQQDYQDVFQLGKFSGKHQDWKPFVAHLLGADSGSIAKLYDKSAERDQAQAELGILTREWGPDESDPSLLDGLIASARRRIVAKGKTLDAFNFRGEDQRTIADVVDELDDRIVALNEELYQQRQLSKRIDDSLEQRKITFDPDAASKLFAEAGVVFDGQLKKDYKQLIEFNRAITEERRTELIKQRADAEEAVGRVETELVELNDRRSESLAFLRETDSLEKYKQTSRELSKLQAELAVLEQRREAASGLAELRRKVRTLSQEFDQLQTVVEDELDELSQDDDSRFGEIRRYFADIVAAVIGEQAILSITLNKSGGVEFRAELMGASGAATSGDKGTSYRKLLCIAFDLAILRAYLDVSFPRFVYLDGALEQLDPRKRENLIEVFRDYAQAGLQPIISLIDSDLPADLGENPRTLSPEDIVLTLHDEGEDGLVFKMPSW
jgi:uncharacterized protein YydD (DUF2326 family)